MGENAWRQMHPALLVDLDRRDRALFVLCADHARARKWWRAVWKLITRLGGPTVTIAASLVPLLLGSDAVRAAAGHSLITLIVSHVIVQLIKRFVRRPRPSVGEAWVSLVHDPDRFSFPSGHSAAAMSVAMAYGIAFPSYAGFLGAAAMLVGASRVFLGVHYPGDVVVGQLLGIATALVL